MTKTKRVPDTNKGMALASLKGRLAALVSEIEDEGEALALKKQEAKALAAILGVNSGQD